MMLLPTQERSFALPTLPFIHLNGTSREALVDGYAKAYCAVDAAINVLFETSPNGRDYYPVEGSYQKARAEHDVRVRALVKVRDELMEIAQGVR